MALAPCCWLVAQALCPTSGPQGHSAPRPPGAWCSGTAASRQLWLAPPAHRLPPCLRGRSAHHLASTGTSTLGPWAYRVCARSLHHCWRRPVELVWQCGPLHRVPPADANAACPGYGGRPVAYPSHAGPCTACPSQGRVQAGVSGCPPGGPGLFVNS